MNTAFGTISREQTFGLVPAWFWLGAGVYALLLINGSGLLNDSDVYWQILVGQWMLDHHALPRVDLYSFTKAGAPWISSSWLAQVLYAKAYDLAGWIGPIVLAVTSIAITFGFLAYILSRHISAALAVVVALAALVLSMDHFLARPHVLALPVMLAWANGMLLASERGEAPSFWLLPLIALWANLHGGFVFGLVLVGAFALDALWNAEISQRRSLLLRWAGFGLCALAACCATPYGWESILAARNILDLGELLHLISEWMPANFSRLGPFEVSVLMLIAGALYGGVKLSPPRIALVLGLLHMAFAHVRNVEIFALLLPIVVVAPVSSQFGLRAARFSGAAFSLAPALMLVGVLGVSTWALATTIGFAPPADQSPAAAVDALKARNPKRIFNDLQFGGYLIWRGIPVFGDGRAELYGEKFALAYYRALNLKDTGALLDLLKTYDIDAALLAPTTPAVHLLDRLEGWQRLYADENAVVHVRVGNGSTSLVERSPAR